MKVNLNLKTLMAGSSNICKLEADLHGKFQFLLQFTIKCPSNLNIYRSQLPNSSYTQTFSNFFSVFGYFSIVINTEFQPLFLCYYHCSGSHGVGAFLDSRPQNHLTPLKALPGIFVLFWGHT